MLQRRLLRCPLQSITNHHHPARILLPTHNLINSSTAPHSQCKSFTVQATQSFITSATALSSRTTAFQVSNSYRRQTSRAMSAEANAVDTSGATQPVWIHTEPYDRRPQFSKLSQDIETDVCIIGAGIAGISTAYELVKRGVKVVLVEAREVLSGETGRTSGHLSSALDDGYVEIAKKHGQKGAKQAADSHVWALNRVGEISKELGIECEYRHLPAYQVSQYARSDPEHGKDVQELKDDAQAAADAGLDAHYDDSATIKGWDGSIDQTGGVVFGGQATFHPTKYLVGLLEYLKSQPNFSCYTNTRVMNIEEKGIQVLGIGSKSVKISTEDGNTINSKHAVEATCVPLQKLSVIAQEEYYRTYCIAMRVPKGYVEDCLIYDSADPYMYVRFTECDKDNDYLVIGGQDHEVGKEDPNGRFEKLEDWVRQRFTKAGSVDYKWSGQVFEPLDNVAFIGKNQGQDNIFIVTGDSGNGLTHGVLAGKLLADEIQGIDNPWASLYDPKRVTSVLKSAIDIGTHVLQANAQYKRFLESDIKDIEDLAPGTGGVLNKPGKTSSGPIAVYKDEGGKVHATTALCPHLKGVVCWNSVEKSWDCPVHGSRFSALGVCVMGPAKANLSPVELEKVM